MKYLQNFVLKTIMFIVWFDLACFALILSGSVFKWSFLNKSISVAFFTAFGVSLMVLLSLAILHVVLTLNLISESISYIAREKGFAESKPSPIAQKRFRAMIVASLGIIFLVVAYQGVLEYRVTRYKVKRIEQELGDIAGSRLVKRLLDIIDQNAAIGKLYFVRDELLLSLEENVRAISLLIPKKEEGRLVFYEITPWECDYKDTTPVSDSLTKLFIPRYKEKEKFGEMLKNKTPFTVVDSYAIRSFYPIVKDGQIKLVLLLDTSREISSDNLLSRSKAGL